MNNVFVAVAATLIFAAPASAMDVHTFLTKAESLQRRGPLALLSRDLKLLLGHVESDLNHLKAENTAAASQGRKKFFCTPDGKVSVSDRNVFEAMRAVPVPQRRTTVTKEAFRAYFARRYPCPPNSAR